MAAYNTIGSRSDLPAVFAIAAFFFSFGLFAILRPAALRNAMDNLANPRKQGSWHPYKMPLFLIRIVVGGTGMLGAALFVYIAFTTLRQ
jgi:hypothetical protein